VVASFRKNAVWRLAYVRAQGIEHPAPRGLRGLRAPHSSRSVGHCSSAPSSSQYFQALILPESEATERPEGGPGRRHHIVCKEVRPNAQPEAAKATAPAPGKQRSDHDKAEAEQQRVAIDAAATKLPSEEVYPERLVDDVRQHRPDRHQAIVCRIYCAARSPSGESAALQMARQPLVGPGRSAAQNHVSEREHAVILVPSHSVVRKPRPSTIRKLGKALKISARSGTRRAARISARRAMPSYFFFRHVARSSKTGEWTTTGTVPTPPWGKERGQATITDMASLLQRRPEHAPILDWGPGTALETIGGLAPGDARRSNG